MKDYELIEHTADIGIRVRADDLKGIFKKSALAMFDIIAEEINPAAKDFKKIETNVRGGNLDELFINWLNELLYQSATKELIFSDFQIQKLDRNNLEAALIGRDNKNYRINTEIKAATYHELQIEQIKSGWQAEIIFDV